jgi:hypothetical protein
MNDPRPPFVRLYRALLRPAGTLPFTILRTGTASVLLAKLASESAHLRDIYGNDGLVPWTLSEIQLADFAPRMIWLSDLLSLWLPSPENPALLLVIACYAAALVFLLAGMGGRAAATVAWLTHLMLLGSGGLSAYGVDTFANIALFYCAVMPCGGARPSTVNALWLRLLQFHMIVVYAVAGTAKARGIEWWTGEAIWRSLMQPQFRVFDYAWLAGVPAVPMIGGWLTLLIETGYPLAMVFRRTRAPWLLAVVGLHLSIGVLMGLRSFAAIMIVLNVAAFGSELAGSFFRSSSLPAPRSSHLRNLSSMRTNQVRS